MSATDRLTKWYGGYIGRHPYVILGVVILLTAAGQYGNTLIKTVVEDNSDIIPDTYPEISSINAIGDEFGGTDSGLIVLEVDPSTTGSDEPRDVRDQRVIEYADLLAKKTKSLDVVTDTTSIADLVREGTHIPKTPNLVNSILSKNPETASYVSDDYTMTLVKINFLSSVDYTHAYDDVEQVLYTTKPPQGVKETLSGDFAERTVLSREMGPDMARTSQFSLIGVLFIAILIFWSLRHGLTSLTAISFGTIWTFGLMGFLGMEVTNVTSGGASMIMGIGIDFGIQVTSRFRIEAAKRKRLDDAMAETMRAVTMPMGTTTLAALIGFSAMSMGEMKILSDLASMMSLGVLCCMMAAVTLVPALLILGERYFGWFSWGKILKIKSR